MYGKTNRQLFASGAKMLSAGVAVFTGVNLYVGNERFYRDFVMPAGHRLLDGETAHRFSLILARYAPKSVWGNKNQDYPRLKTKVFGLDFPNPLGVAAGFDKDAESLDGLCAKSGFGFVEVGSVTPMPQPGNPKPRVFRLPEDRAVINRYGFNSAGYDVFEENLEKSIAKLGHEHPVVIGINLGKNKTDTKYIDGYCEGYRRFAANANYLVINLSSPNTPGLRDLQKRAEMDSILKALAKEKSSKSVPPPPVLLKVSPDLSDDDLKDIADLAVKHDMVDGLIVTNTTVSRDGLRSKASNESGGLSGPPLAELSNKCIKLLYKETKGAIPIVGCGGISSGKDAYEKIRSGASLVQIYTALVYEGFPVVNKIKRELHECLKRDGFEKLADAVGADVR